MQGPKNSPRDTFQNCVRAKGRGREREEERGVDFSPLEGLIYMTVLLSNKKEKNLFFLALCIFIRAQCFSVRQKCVFGGGH